MNLLPFLITAVKVNEYRLYSRVHTCSLIITYCGWGSVVHRDRCIAYFGLPFAQEVPL